MGGFLKNVISEQLVLPSKTIFKTADVFHAASPEDGCLIPLIKKPSVVTFHDILPLTTNERHSIFNFYFKYCCNLAKRADAIIAVSEYTKKELVRVLNISPDKIHVVPNGVNLKRFKPLKRKNTGRRIGYVGGLGKRKNVKTLIRSFALVLEEIPDAELVIGGTGPQKENLKILTKQLGITSRTKFVGFIPNNKMNEFYNSLDIFVFPSLGEGFGMPVLEAMAAGVPVITSNVSSLPEICDSAAILVPPRKSMTLAQKISLLIKNKKMRERMKRKGIENSKRFSWEKAAKKTIRVYRRCI